MLCNKLYVIIALPDNHLMAKWNLYSRVGLSIAEDPQNEVIFPTKNVLIFYLYIYINNIYHPWFVCLFVCSSFFSGIKNISLSTAWTDCWTDRLYGHVLLIIITECIEGTVKRVVSLWGNYIESLFFHSVLKKDKIEDLYRDHST